MVCTYLDVYLDSIHAHHRSHQAHWFIIWSFITLLHCLGQMTDVNITDLASNWHQERLQVPTVTGICNTNESTATSSTLGLMLQRASNSSAAVSVSLSSPKQPTAEAEVKPTLYEELKLGHEGVGFKRLVWEWAQTMANGSACLAKTFCKPKNLFVFFLLSIAFPIWQDQRNINICM